MNANQQSNPCGLDGFSFLEFSGPDPTVIENQLKAMGFRPIAQHKNQNITQFQQGEIQFIINAAQHCQAETHAKQHGAGACAMGFKVKDVHQAFEYAVAHGATPFEDATHANHSLPAIQAIGGSVIYFIDDQHPPFANQWQAVSFDQKIPECGLKTIDHLTHNVFRGNMDKWATFYASIFNFKEIRFFDIKGQMTGLISRALASPCGKIKIPLNESKDEHSQIEEFLHAYQGEGIQHMALSTTNIYQTVSDLSQHNVPFLNVPDTYYEMLSERIPWHQEPIEKLRQLKILIDGETTSDKGLLLQIFTENIFGPVFFEIIQRKGNDGFGEGNFQALFEAIERDQIKRGTLKGAST